MIHAGGANHSLRLCGFIKFTIGVRAIVFAFRFVGSKILRVASRPNVVGRVGEVTQNDSLFGCGELKLQRACGWGGSLLGGAHGLNYALKLPIFLLWFINEEEVGAFVKCFRRGKIVIYAYAAIFTISKSLFKRACLDSLGRRFLFHFELYVKVEIWYFIYLFKGNIQNLLWHFWVK